MYSVISAQVLSLLSKMDVTSALIWAALSHLILDHDDLNSLVGWGVIAVDAVHPSDLRTF